MDDPRTAAPNEVAIAPSPSPRAREDARLFARYRRTGDQDARDELVARFLPLAKRLARAVRRSRRVRRSRPGRVVRVAQGDRPLRPRAAGSRSPRTPCRRSWARSSATSATTAGPCACHASCTIARCRSSARRSSSRHVSGDRPRRPRSPRRWTPASNWCSRRSRPRAPGAPTGSMRPPTPTTTSADGPTLAGEDPGYAIAEASATLAPLLARLTPREQRDPAPALRARSHAVGDRSAARDLADAGVTHPAQDDRPCCRR